MGNFGTYKHIKKTRKEHECSVCGRQIDIGESCHKYVGVFDGEFQSWYGCKTCFELQDEFIYANDSYCDPDFVQEVIYEKIYGWECPICGEEKDYFDLDTKYNNVKIVCCGDPNHTNTYDLISLVRENKLIGDKL